MGFDGSSIEGFARIDESDMIAKPDPSTFTITHGAQRMIALSDGCSVISIIQMAGLMKAIPDGCSDSRSRVHLNLVIRFM